MTRKDSKRTISEIKAMIGGEGDFLRPMVRTVIQEFLARREGAGCGLDPDVYPGIIDPEGQSH